MLLPGAQFQPLSPALSSRLQPRGQSVDERWRQPEPRSQPRPKCVVQAVAQRPGLSVPPCPPFFAVAGAPGRLLL